MYLDTHLAPLAQDGWFYYLRNLGTDLQRFADLFDRFEIVEGEMVPEGERGFEIAKRVYDRHIKHRVAVELDKLNRERQHRGATDLFGYTAEEIRGSPIDVLAPLTGNTITRGVLERIRSGDNVQHYETERVRKDGSALSVSINLSPIRGLAGGVTGISMVARDVSDRRRTETKMRRLAAIV